MKKDNCNKATVIIPVFNSQKYLDRCLNSILSQKNISNYEVICIDDCSTDESREILKRYQQLYGIKVIYNAQNIGQGRSRIEGIENSTGDYIFFVDSDDYIAEDYLSTYMECVRNKEYDVVVGGFITVREKKKKICKRQNGGMGSIISYSHACCKMYRKQFLIDNNIDFGDYRKGEDIFWSISLVVKNARHKFIDYTGYYYYHNEKSTTKTLDYKDNFEQTVSDIFSEILLENKVEKNSNVYKFIEYAYVAGMLNALIIYNHGCGRKIILQKYSYFLTDLEKKFGRIEDNKFLYKWYWHGPSFKCRFGVWSIMNLNRIHIDKILFGLIGFL